MKSGRSSIVQKPRLCKCGCGELIPQGNTLRKAASIECALKLAKSDTEKKERKLIREAKKVKANERKALKARAEKAKTLKALCAEAREVVQKYARLRDWKYGRCICCGTGAIEHGGHYFAVGSKYQCARLSLNAEQIHGCCVRCNSFVGGGNRPGYDEGLTRRYGPGKLVELQELKRRADSGEDEPLTKDDVRAIKKEFSAKCRELIKHRDDMMMNL